MGNITTQQGPIAGIEGQDNGAAGTIDLVDVQLSVVAGASPWNSTTIPGFLAAGNSSMGNILPVTMLPEAPYLNLPQSTCDAIAAWLPLTYNPSLGLYTWNINDPLYRKIITSPSVLSFILRRDQLNTANLTINVPFLLLNLTLQPPLTNIPVAYFPCNAQAHDRYSLGRAFLQAAFIGANWNANNAQGVWWLAQAPGPAVEFQTSVKELQDQDTAIAASSSSWLASWQDSWTLLEEESKVVNATSTAASAPGPTDSDTSSHAPAAKSDSTTGMGLSTAVRGAIGAAIIVSVLAVMCLGIYLFRKKRKPVENVEYMPNGGIVNRWTKAELSASHQISEMEYNQYHSGGHIPAELNEGQVKRTFEMG